MAIPQKFSHILQQNIVGREGRGGGGGPLKKGSSLAKVFLWRLLKWYPKVREVLKRCFQNTFDCPLASPGVDRTPMCRRPRILLIILIMRCLSFCLTPPYSWSWHNWAKNPKKGASKFIFPSPLASVSSDHSYHIELLCLHIISTTQFSSPPRRRFYILKKVYDSVMVSIFVMVGSLTKSGSMKKKTGISTVSPAFSLCSSKQKHCILLKYGATCAGVTLYVATPMMSSSLLFVAV